MSARRELLALLECVVPLDKARDMVDRHHAEVLATTALADAVAEHGPFPMPTGDRAPVEDPHDSPLHQSYATPRDLPEILTQRNGGQL